MKRLKAKKGYISLFLVVGLVLLVGCGKPAEKDNQAETEKEQKQTDDKQLSTDEKVKIRFASWDSSEDLEKQQKLVDRFNQRNDKIEVVLEAYGDDYDTKIAAGMGSKDAPDVMYMWNYPNYYEALEPLDSYIKGEGEEYKDNFYQTLWSYNGIGDSIYGIPVGYTTHVLYYNKAIFDKAELNYPTDDWTWTDLQAAAKKISESVDNVKGFSFMMKPDPYDFEMYLWSNETAYSDEQGHITDYLNSEANIEVLTMFQKMEKEGIALATEKSGTDEMLGGKVAMYINGAWPIGRFTEEKLDFGVAKIPHFKKDSASILSSSGLAMSKDSTHKKEAWEFIKYWTSEELNKERLSYELPVLKSVVKSEKIEEDEIKRVFFKMLEQSAGYVPSSFKVKEWSQFSDELGLGFERIFNESAYEDPEQVMDELVAGYGE